MEERRQAFLDESVRNPYFKYSLGTTIALLIMAMLYSKQWIDHRRAMWITAEMMRDLYNHDANSRGVAREAIQKYNDHIERCNRAIEAADHGMSIPGADSDANNLKGVPDSVADERDSYKRERDLAKRDLLEKEKLIADMSVRLDAMAKKTDPNRAAAVSIDMSAADPKVVQLINNLQEQLYAERRVNPNRPLQMIGRVFECAEPCVWHGQNKLLFNRLLNAPEKPDGFLVVVRAQLVGKLAIGRTDWRSAGTWLISFSESCDQQEAILLMPAQGWMQTELGRFVLEPEALRPWVARLVLASA